MGEGERHSVILPENERPIFLKIGNWQAFKVIQFFQNRPLLSPGFEGVLPSKG
jgi:hypothetical protein